MVLAFHRGIEFRNKSRMHVRSESLRLVGQRARDLWTGGGYRYPLLSVHSHGDVRKQTWRDAGVEECA